MASSPLTRYRIPLAISSFAALIISFIVYWVTADPSVSYWDCPEYVTVASRMEIGHPPGNPIWMLAMRVATIPFPLHLHAYVINVCSGLFMAFAVFFLCRIIFIVARVSFNYSNLRNKFSESQSDLLASFIALGGSLCFAFCDSVWFSAVEAEVYAMSTFLSALSLWIMVIWWWERSLSKRRRLLILLGYITGLSLGVHQLNLLLIPVFALIMLYRHRPGKINTGLVLLIIALSCGLIALILMVLIPLLMKGAQRFELFGVNGLSLPYNSGVILFISLIFILLLIALGFSSYLGDLIKRNIYRTYQVNTALWVISFLLLGFTSYAIIMIRANSYPQLNEGVPDNIFSLASYIAREQYPSTPLIYGATPYSRPMLMEEFADGRPSYSRYLLEKGTPRYKKVISGAILNHRSGMVSHGDSLENKRIMERGRGYVLEDYNFNQILTPELNMWFPRITSRKPSQRLAYNDWAGMSEETMLRVPITEVMDTSGRYRPKTYLNGTRPQVYSYRPTYMQNLRYFISYQSYYMYFRYLFWNFIGRQNDYPSTGEIEHGNFITGFPFIDYYLGNTDEMPSEIRENNPGRNRYFAIPFVFGLIGVLYLGFFNRRSRRILSVVSLLFLMTGIAIVIYLNQSPGEPRERDYTFLVSYMAFTMLISAGFMGIVNLLGRKINVKLVIVVCGLLSLGTPALMTVENFDDHNRSGRYEPTFFVSSLLDFESPAIIFSQGDNSSFPLWYASEVLGMGPRHTPIDVTYLSLPSYAVNLKKQGDKGLSTVASYPELAFNGFVLSRIPHDSVAGPLPLNSLLKGLYESEPGNPVFPSSRFILPQNGGDSVVVDLREFTKGSSFLPFKHLMLLDIIDSQLKAENPKVLFFPALMDYSFYKPLEPLLQETLFGKIYAPWLSEDQIDSITKKSVEREVTKLKSLELKPHYMDPVLKERTQRYRGELLIRARKLFDKGDVATAKEIADVIDEIYPYRNLLPGDFTIADSTFYEGKTYSRFLKDLYKETGNQKYQDTALMLDSIMMDRYRQWLLYYNSLSPSQRATLSNKSKRLLIKPNIN